MIRYLKKLLMYWICPNRMRLSDRLEIAVPGLVVKGAGGKCPVQMEGLLNGYPVYFRSRGDHWRLSVAHDINGDPLDYEASWGYGKGYGVWPDAGWMPDKDVVQFMKEAASKYQERT